jgi:pyruvate ferredoxin oxidoreductase alpha subunit
MEQQFVAMTGNEAVATAYKQCRPHVASAFPITPQTEMMHKFSDFVANGEVDTEMILVESEHSAMSAAIGAQAAGARTITATSSAGFALMWEMVYVAASLRLPISMALVNRALSGNINIHNDHSDSMGGRDAGWIQLYCEDSQEAYDTALMSFRIAEHAKVKLPIMVCYDGFIISHTSESIKIISDDAAWKFVGPYKPERKLLDTDNPYTIGPLDLTDYYFEHKISQLEACDAALPVIESVQKEFGELSGRHYGHFELYKFDDADAVIVVIGSTAGTAKDVIDQMRADGKKVGLLKLRTFRPFPATQLAKVLAGKKAVGVMDRVASFGGYGSPTFNEICCALYGVDNAPPLYNWIYGLGGRDCTMELISNVFADLLKVAGGDRLEKTVNLLGVRV